MPLTVGARVGPYEIEVAIGAGGMGEVYRARDTKLHRDVAIKILPEALAGDPAAQARFEGEVFWHTTGFDLSRDSQARRAVGGAVGLSTRVSRRTSRGIVVSIRESLMCRDQSAGLTASGAAPG